jgi:hypothetical protein
MYATIFEKSWAIAYLSISLSGVSNFEYITIWDHYEIVLLG